MLVDNFLLWKVRTPEILGAYIEGYDPSGSVDRTCCLIDKERTRYYVPYYVYCGVNVGDTFWITKTLIFKHTINITHTFKGIIYTDNVRMLNFPNSSLYIFTFMIIMVVFDFFYPQFSDDTTTQLHLAMAIFAVTLYGIYGYVYM